MKSIDGSSGTCIRASPAGGGQRCKNLLWHQTFVLNIELFHRGQYQQMIIFHWLIAVINVSKYLNGVTIK
jgi:hypothetical protein